MNLTSFKNHTFKASLTTLRARGNENSLSQSCQAKIATNHLLKPPLPKSTATQLFVSPVHQATTTQVSVKQLKGTAKGTYRTLSIMLGTLDTVRRSVGSLVFSWQEESTQFASYSPLASLEKMIFSLVIRRERNRTVNPRDHLITLGKKFSAVIQIKEFLAVKTFKEVFAHCTCCNLSTSDLMEFIKKTTCSSLLLKKPDCWLTAG